MAAQHPALGPELQSKTLRHLMRAIVRLQCWHGQPVREYLAECRMALRSCLSGAAPIWRSEHDTYAWWLEQTRTDVQHSPSLHRRWHLVKKLREQILLHNQRMVIRLAHKKIPNGMDYSDLVMEGNLGLMRAVDLFDPRKNYRFSTYAHFWIDQAITLALKQKGHTVRTPLSALNKAWQEHKQAMEEADATHSPQPTYYPLQRETVSLDDPDRALSIPDESSDESRASVDAKRLVSQLTKDLPERLRRVLALRYGIEQRDAVGYREIADQLGVSRERARQLEQEALQILREDSPDDDTHSALNV
ncbi:MAG: sigma-70 family RNA polymerase sigma factor [Natronospirillum sp.]